MTIPSHVGLFDELSNGFLLLGWLTFVWSFR